MTWINIFDSSEWVKQLFNYNLIFTTNNSLNGVRLKFFVVGIESSFWRSFNCNYSKLFQRYQVRFFLRFNVLNSDHVPVPDNQEVFSDINNDA